MFRVSFVVLMMFFFSACKKEPFQKCIKDYEHEYVAVLSCDNTEVTFPNAKIQRSILSNEMEIWYNTDAFPGAIDVTVDNDCSFIVNPMKYIVLPNQDTLRIQEGSADARDGDIEIILESDYDDNCTLTLERKVM